MVLNIELAGRLIMCNISGYIGDKRAAPILFEMMKNQEGYCAGYYTGITTLHEGKLFTAKVLGDVSCLLAQTDAINFPGNVGIIHSRSNSGGDWRWSHPFVTADEKLSVCLNGAAGKYATAAKLAEAANYLSDLGVKFFTESEYTDRIKGYPKLKNGNYVHTSEVIAQLAHHHLTKNPNMPSYLALEAAFLDVPKEAVVLSVCADEPGAISYAKMNMPMAIARTENEVFLSSFSICFPKDREYVSLDELPQESSGKITLDALEMHRFKSPKPMGRMTPSMMHDAYDIIIKTLEENGECGIGTLNQAVRVMWGDDVDLRYLATYAVLQDLSDKGKIRTVKRMVSGPSEANDPNMKVPSFTLVLTDYANDNCQNDKEIGEEERCDTTR